MLQNYFKIAFRNLLKFKGYTAINIGGLAIGVTACLLILQFVTSEFNVDQHHANAENLYRVDTEFFIGDRQWKSSSTPPPIAKRMQADFPEVIKSARVYKVPDVTKWLLKYENQAFFERNGIFADSTLFEVLTFEFLQGDKTTALDEPFSVVISKEIAKKLFGEADPMGKTIEINSSWGENEYKITGVFDRNKYASHLAGNFYVSGMSGNIGRRFHRLQEWGGNNLYYTYIQLQDGVTEEAVEAKIPDWLESHAGERFRELGMHKKHYLTPITDIYLYTGSGNWFGKKGSITFLYLLMSVAAFIILIACINFMNLATAKATLRAKEVGVRKVIGASRGMLIKQFMSEALVYSSLAVVFAYVFSELLMPLFSQMVDKDLTQQSLDTSTVLGWLFGFILLVTLVAGSYPALYLSSFSPSKIFKNDFGNKLSSTQIRKGLVIIQFIISIALIQGILVINEQMNFISQRNLGFNPEAKIVFPVNTYEVFTRINPLRNELMKNNQINEVTATSDHANGSNMESYFYFKEGQTPDEGFHSLVTYATPEYMKMMDFELIKGRFFDRKRLADTTRTAVISEMTMHGMGFTLDSVIGQKIFMEWEGDRLEREIIGVVKDFHTGSLHYEIQGQIFDWSPDRIRNYIIASVSTENIPSLLKSIEQSWQKVNPDVPFESYFLDADLQKNYEADQRMNALIFWGTMLAIFISCLGLLGLAAFAAERREKEIGIRKILGASIVNIVSMLSKDFIKLVVIALVLATPIAWYGMNNWLQNFHYRIEMPWWSYALAGILAIVVAMGTIGFQSLRAASVNPVDSLRNE